MYMANTYRSLIDPVDLASHGADLPSLPEHCIVMRLLGSALLTLQLVGVADVDAQRTPAQRTVMSWVEEAPPWNQTSHFILRGAAKGAVNAVSVGLGWGFKRAPNGSFSFVSDAVTRKQFQEAWQGTDAKAVGLRVYPVMGLPGVELFSAPNLDEMIADLCAEVQAAGVQGINIDYECVLAGLLWTIVPPGLKNDGFYSKHDGFYTFCTRMMLQHCCEFSLKWPRF